MGKFKIIEGRDSKLIFQNNLKRHKNNMKKIGVSIDNKEPESYTYFAKKKAALSPRRDQDQYDGIAHNNLKLANRIFDIMEGPGIITHILKKRESDHGAHPGTLNFKMRVKEATRIHKQNISMAMRLDNVRPYYGKLFAANRAAQAAASPPKSAQQATGRKNKHNVPGLKFPNSLFNQDGLDTTRTDPGGKTRKVVSKQTKQSKSAREESSKESGNSSARKNNVLLEYSKIQNGRVLDVAVIKEPFRDRYAIFGIDIDNGKRFELRLTSDDVSSILDGDILVTSLDNVEVWLALLNKVTLNPVEMFSKLSSQPPEEQRIGVATPLEPEAPAMERPTTRPGGRGSRSQARSGSETKMPSSDHFENGLLDDAEPLMQVPVVVDSVDAAESIEDATAQLDTVESVDSAEIVEQAEESEAPVEEIVETEPVEPMAPSAPPGVPSQRPTTGGRKA